MYISKRRIIMSAFFKSQFSYCPLVWMCHSRANHSKINKLQERCLRMICSGFSIYNRNLQLPPVEMCKASKGLSPPIISEPIEKKNKY